MGLRLNSNVFHMLIFGRKAVAPRSREVIFYVTFFTMGLAPLHHKFLDLPLVYTATYLRAETKRHLTRRDGVHE